MTPDFLQHFELRWSEGGFPFSGNPTPGFSGWCRLPGLEGTLDPSGVAGLVDAWPSPALTMMKTPAPASSVSWMLDFVGDPGVAADGWFYYRTHMRASDRGYAYVDAELWDDQGRAVARGRQLVSVFG
jgi:acyl-CoA hydrolase